MKSFVAGLLATVVLVGPVSAETRHHRYHGRHVVGTSPRHGQPGFPITAAQDSIRINSVGEVISQPVPVNQKERSFNAKARSDLRNTGSGMPSSAPVGMPMR